MKEPVSLDQFLHGRSLISSIRIKMKSFQKSVDFLNDKLKKEAVEQKSYYQDQIKRIESEIDEFNHQKLVLFKVNSSTTLKPNSELELLVYKINSKNQFIKNYKLLIELINTRCSLMDKQIREKEYLVEAYSSDLKRLEFEYYKSNQIQDLILKIESEVKKIDKKISALNSELSSNDSMKRKNKIILEEIQRLKAEKKNDLERINELRKESDFIIKEVG